MNSDFLNKFQGKTYKIPKHGVLNLIHSTPLKPIKLPPKPKHSNPTSQPKHYKNQNHPSKLSSNNKQNLNPHHSNSIPQPNKSPSKTINKKNGILSLKDNKKPPDFNVKPKREPLKLPKIKKPEPFINSKSVRQLQKLNTKPQLKQNFDTIPLPQKPQKQNQKLKRSLLTQVRQLKPQRSQMGIFGFENTLDDETLRQLKKLNDLQIIVQQISFKRRQQMRSGQFHDQKHNRKGYTVHC